MVFAAWRDLCRLSEVSQDRSLHPIDGNLDLVPVGMFAGRPEKPPKVVDKSRNRFQCCRCATRGAGRIHRVDKLGIVRGFKLAIAEPQPVERKHALLDGVDIEFWRFRADPLIRIVPDEVHHLVHAWLRRRPGQSRMLNIHGDIFVLLGGCQCCRHVTGWRFTKSRMCMNGHILVREPPVECRDKLIDEIGIQPAACRFQIEPGMTKRHQLVGKGKAPGDSDIGIILNADRPLRDDVVPGRPRLGNGLRDASQTARVVQPMEILQNIHPHGRIFEDQRPDHVIGLGLITEEKITAGQRRLPDAEISEMGNQLFDFIPFVAALLGEQVKESPATCLDGVRAGQMRRRIGIDNFLCRRICTKQRLHGIAQHFLKFDLGHGVVSSLPPAAAPMRLILICDHISVRVSTRL